MMRVLLSHGADCNAVKSELGSIVPVLASAVQSGTLAQVEFLLEAGADVNYRTEGGYNVLIHAMNSRSMEEKESMLSLLELLLAHGAPVHGESDWGESALSISSHNARFDVVKRLLQAGADGDVLEWTPLMFFIALGDTATVEQLLRAGADLEARDGWERTPFLLSLETGDVEKAKLLLEAGSDLNQRSRCGKTALMHAIESGQPEMFAWLIAQGADLNAQDEFGETALMKAAEDGATEFVRQLIKAGADIHLTNATEQRKQSIIKTMDEMDLDLPDSLKAKLERDDRPGETAIN
jgi:ankyrin repeat protein